MKTCFLSIILFVVFILGTSCSQNSKPNKLKDFVDEIISLGDEQFSGSVPISQLEKIAAQQSSKTIILSKSNIAQSLDEAKSYRGVLIMIGSHTVLKIVDFNDCQKSTAWGTCMPVGLALIQKDGDFIREKDYINKLIGLPDGQPRKMFLFN